MMTSDLKILVVAITVGLLAGPVIEWLSRSIPIAVFQDLTYLVRFTTNTKRVFATIFMTAATAALLFRYGVTIKGAAACLFTATLLILAIIDAETELLPDVLTLPLIVAGVIVNIGTMYVLPFQSVLGAIAGYLSLLIFYLICRFLAGQEVMGFGDFKLFAAIGAWLGWAALPIVLLLAGVSLTIYAYAINRKKSKDLPFGPHLAVGALACILFGNVLSSMVPTLGFVNA